MIVNNPETVLENVAVDFSRVHPQRKPGEAISVISGWDMSSSKISSVADFDSTEKGTRSNSRLTNMT